MILKKRKKWKNLFFTKALISVSILLQIERRIWICYEILKNNDNVTSQNLFQQTT